MPAFSKFMSELAANPTLYVVMVAVITGQLLKVPWKYLRLKRWDWSMLWSASGMPSTHSAAVSALYTIVGLESGFDSLLFAVTLVIAMIVMYDARGVRRAAGEQAEAINYLLDIEADIEHRQHKILLEQRIGHTLYQVIGGALWGMGMAYFLYHW